MSYSSGNRFRSSAAATSMESVGRHHRFCKNSLASSEGARISVPVNVPLSLTCYLLPSSSIYGIRHRGVGEKRGERDRNETAFKFQPLD
ncbi:hypothetical protein KSP39_PZI009215 [Platanthera zijinensis]|uniref:Uncharacterized protein n=1 Tax=Platanthera zijinensis TaxID=2320716 RepID=A0AAP0BL17_9ASPA